jgi:uncharacterized membrane-anchored protein YhcB (DUF1043 family)
MPEILWLVVGAALGGGAGVWFGGRSSRERLQRLQGELAAAHVRLQAASEELKQQQEEHEQYRTRVVGHFSDTSDLFQDLTLQYRAFYDHLAEGARALCPEGSLRLGGDLDLRELPSERLGVPSRDATGERDASEEAPPKRL